MTKILMVCLGNICRSPLAEGILTSKVNSNEVLVDSAGTSAFHVGEHPDRRSIAIASDYGIDISSQRSRKFIKNDFMEFDYIFVMDRSNYSDVIALANTEEQKRKVSLILSSSNDLEQEVPDPYYGGEDGFKNVYLMLEAACEQLLKKLSI